MEQARQVQVAAGRPDAEAKHTPGRREDLGGFYPVGRMNLRTVVARLRRFDGVADLNSQERDQQDRLKARLRDLLARDGLGSAASAKATGASA